MPTKNLQRATLQSQAILFTEVDGKRVAPEWVPLLPAGEVILARDGRHFIANHEAAIESFAQSGMDLPIDWDHALDTWGVAPGDSRAAAWVDQLEVREGALWGHVSMWTARGKDSVESCEYRYISPVIYFDDDRKVVQLPRASLVNNPALKLPALCREEVNPMNEHLLRLLAGLNLTPETLSEEGIGAALETFSRGKTGAPSLDSYIPRDQYEAVVGELASTKATLETYQAAQHQEKVQRVIREALNSGRLMPSERQFFEAQAAKDLPSVETFLASRSPIIGNQKAAPLAISDDPSSLTDEEKTVAKAGGISLSQFAAAKAARKKA